MFKIKTVKYKLTAQCENINFRLKTKGGDVFEFKRSWSFIEKERYPYTYFTISKFDGFGVYTKHYFKEGVRIQLGDGAMIFVSPHEIRTIQVLEFSKYEDEMIVEKKYHFFKPKLDVEEKYKHRIKIEEIGKES